MSPTSVPDFSVHEPGSLLSLSQPRHRRPAGSRRLWHAPPAHSPRGSTRISLACPPSCSFWIASAAAGIMTLRELDFQGTSPNDPPFFADTAGGTGHHRADWFDTFSTTRNSEPVETSDPPGLHLGLFGSLCRSSFHGAA